MKPYYRIKGKYADGRQRVVIEHKVNGGIILFTLPKPEILLGHQETIKNLCVKSPENTTPKTCSLMEPLVNEGEKF